MKIAITALVVMLVSCFAPSTGATPPPWSAKFQLPAQASDRANPPSKPTEIVPPLPPPPLPPPPVPVILASFTSGQTTTTAAQAQAVAAIQSATITVKTRLANSTSISVITMTATVMHRRTTPSPPLGRSGDLDNVRWRFNDRFGRTIGTGTTLCRWTTFTRRLCWGEMRLPRGKLVALGSSQTRALGEFAVIGGTGVYLFKQGMMTFSQLSVRKYAIRVLLA